MESGLRFIDRKQEEHKKEFGVYADTCHKLGEWCEEYAKQYHEEQVKLGLPSVSQQRELFVKGQGKWLMVNTNMDVEQIIDFEMEFINK
jgi:hypothetical protein